MTNKKINSFKKGTKCQICTGCGRCFWDKPMQIVHTFSLGNNECDMNEGRKRLLLKKQIAISAPEYIIAIDLGTTTIAMQLRRTADGTVLDTFTALNPQRKYGEDVLSRIAAAEADYVKADMQTLVKKVLEQGVNRFLNLLSEQLEAADGKNRCSMVIAANPTMIHLLLDLSVEKLGQYPFEAETLQEMQIELFGLKVLILPGIATFIGGDIVAGIEVLSMNDKSEVTLLLDLGTNGEIVLGNREHLVATSTAAGPAFEGEGKYYGTDLMSVIAQLRRENILDETGLLAEPYFETGIDAGGVHVSQQYIRRLQAAKAAICTGIVILCEKYGLESFDEIQQVFLAGGMGGFLEPQAAAAIGLFPQVLADKTIAVGNTALEGAFWYGREYEWKQKERTAEEQHILEAALDKYHCEAFNLAEEGQFSQQYIENMFLVPYGENE